MKRTGLLRSVSLLALALLGSCNELAGIKPGDPIGSPIACENDGDCPAPAEPECSTFVACSGAMAL